MPAAGAHSLQFGRSIEDSSDRLHVARPTVWRRLALVVAPQIEHRADAQAAQSGEVIVAQPVQGVGSEQPKTL
jgi:hypothetical protein